MKKDSYLHKTLRNQRGVVLIIALILLVIISLLAVSTLHNATSTESVAGNVRTTELATQAADIALRYCESSVLKVVNGDNTQDFKSNNILGPDPVGFWQETSTWDTQTPTKVYTIPLTVLQLNGIGDIYKRSPECMVEQLLTKSTTSSFYLITARGFGPEVPALVSGTRIRPVGTEVWLQSQIEI